MVQLDLSRRARAAGVHLLISAVIAALAASLVFGLWFPGIYRQIAGGKALFLLITGVDIVLGPLLTFAVFNVKKGWPHLKRDLAVIGVLQTAALVYGLHTVFIVRPVAMVFEVDRFRMVSAVDVHTPELPLALPVYQELPLSGPWLLGARSVKPDEKTDALFLGLEGVDVGQRPRFWQPYDLSRTAALARSRPLAALVEKYPSQKQMIEDAAVTARLKIAEARFLPLAARGDWVVLLDSNGDVRGYVPLDGFF